MAAPNIRIDIASVFKDKGFKQASKSSTALERQFKSLGRTFLTVFSTAAIVKFGKESARAFAEDEKAARRLEQTLKGVNLGFAAPQVESYISSLEKSSGILDDDLRPALESLIRTTGTVTTAQRLLGTAIEVSAGSGVNLVTVAGDLAKAYVGNTRGLAKYNTGLTKTELQTKSFAEIQKVLNDQFTGQRAAYLTTYAGKTEALRVAYANMQETIGKGLVDAFMEIQGENGIEGATSAMEKFGNTLADVARGVGVVAGQVNKLTGANTPFGDFLNKLTAVSSPFAAGLKALSSIGQGARRSDVTPGGRILAGMNEARLKAAEEASIRRQKELEKLRTKSIKAQEKSNKLRALSAKLDKTASKYDLERIQIAAALQGKISENERLRLQELQTIHEAREAIAAGDLEASEKLMALLEKLGAKFTDLDAALRKVKETDPFEKMKDVDPFPNMKTYVEKAQAELNKLKAPSLSYNIATNYVRIGSQLFPNITYSPEDMPDKPTAAAIPQPELPTIPLPTTLAELLADTPGAVGGGAQTNVTVNVAGTVIAEQDLTNTILNNLYSVQKSGRRVSLREYPTI